MHMAHPISLIGGRDSPSARATPIITIARFAVFATDCEVAPRYRRDAAEVPPRYRRGASDEGTQHEARPQQRDPTRLVRVTPHAGLSAAHPHPNSLSHTRTVTRDS